MFVRLKQFCRFLWILRLRGSRGANLSKPLNPFSLCPGTNKPPKPPKSDFKKKSTIPFERAKNFSNEQSFSQNQKDKKQKIVFRTRPKKAQEVTF